MQSPLLLVVYYQYNNLLALARVHTIHWLVCCRRHRKLNIFGAPNQGYRCVKQADFKIAISPTRYFGLS